MTTRGRIAACLVVAVLAWVAFMLLSRRTSQGTIASSGMTGAGPSAAAALPAAPPSSLGAALPPPERSTLADALNSPATDIRSDLKVVASIVDTYRSNFLSTGNPVGSNAEITAALTGGNRLRLALIPADHPAINAEGELCDRWGTPFFFHAESATRMEIRSAGPDRTMWSEDDIAFTP